MTKAEILFEKLAKKEEMSLATKGLIGAGVIGAGIAGRKLYKYNKAKNILRSEYVNGSHPNQIKSGIIDMDEWLHEAAKEIMNKPNFGRGVFQQL